MKIYPLLPFYYQEERADPLVSHSILDFGEMVFYILYIKGYNSVRVKTLYCI